MATTPSKSRPAMRKNLLRLMEHAEWDDGGPTTETKLRMTFFEDILEGFDALDHGEMPHMFRRSKGKGPAPHRVRMLQIKAVAHVRALQSRNMTLEKAYGEIADAYGLEAGTIKKWRAELMKQEPSKHEFLPDKLALGDLIRQDKAMAGRPLPSITQVRVSVGKDGVAFRKLTGK
jgi:hypothetical protein